MNKIFPILKNFLFRGDSSVRGNWVIDLLSSERFYFLLTKAEQACDKSNFVGAPLSRYSNSDKKNVMIADMTPINKFKVLVITMRDNELDTLSTNEFFYQLVCMLMNDIAIILAN